MSDFQKPQAPEIMEDPTGESRLAQVKTERAYLEIPQDEIPNEYGMVKEAEHIIAPEVRVSVVWNQRPLLEAVNEAVVAGDVKRVAAIFNGARIVANIKGPKLVHATCLPPK